MHVHNLYGQCTIYVFFNNFFRLSLINFGSLQMIFGNLWNRFISALKSVKGHLHPKGLVHRVHCL